TGTPNFAHPEFDVSRAAALNQCVQRLARVGAEKLASVPGMAGVVGAPVGFCACAWSGAFSPAPARRPLVEMPARAIEQREKTVSCRRLLASVGQLGDERQLLVIKRVDLLRLGRGLADHLGELAHAGAVDLAEV